MTYPGIVYLIQSNSGSIYKIGMTRNWAQRSTQLRVGTRTKEVFVAKATNPEAAESALHDWHRHKRLPQSEWFELSERDLAELLHELRKLNRAEEERVAEAARPGWGRRAAGTTTEDARPQRIQAELEEARCRDRRFLEIHHARKVLRKGPPTALDTAFIVGVVAFIPCYFLSYFAASAGNALWPGAVYVPLAWPLLMAALLALLIRHAHKMWRKSYAKAMTTFRSTR